MAQAAAMAQTMPPQAPGTPQDETAAQAQGNQTGGEETGPSAIQGPRVNLQSQAPQ
jgi:hypothetical protein